MQTITKVFNNYDQAERAVTALEEAGIRSSEISLVANKGSDRHIDDDDTSEVETGAGVGAAVGGAAGLLTGLGLMAIPGVGPVVAAGWLVSTAVGAVAGGATGGIVGALVDAGVDDEHAQVYSEAVRRGGSLLSVRAEESQVNLVQAILDEYSPLDPTALNTEYRNAGWTGFDPNVEPRTINHNGIDRNGRIV